MKKNDIIEFPSLKMDTIKIQDATIVTDKVFMSHRVCDACGKSKDTYGGYSCSKGHFICHSCGSSHVHCPLCGHTLR